MKGDAEALFIEVALLIAVFLLIALMLSKAETLLGENIATTQKLISLKNSCLGECFYGKVGEVNVEELEKAGIVIKYWEENATYIKMVREGNVTYVIAWK